VLVETPCQMPNARLRGAIKMMANKQVKIL
jgi:hypothetical protein